ncbi:MAG: transglycosylase SLT domain-containing protein, partial [Alphaproteobacteria bacterium]|nr:transglycosylase SLT domain-containing protein [Alphaproteobacteria bacterium]
DRRRAALAKVNRAEEALAVAELLASRHPPTTAAAWDALGRARYNARQYADACEAWTHVVGEPATSVGGPQALFDTALCFARTGDYDTAAVVYRRVIAQHPTTKQADFASFKLGYMEQDRGDCAKAVPLFDEHRARYPASKHTDEALWFTARCAVLAGDVAAAEQAWSTLERVAPSSSLVPGAAYWRVRLAGGEGATAGYERVLRSWPASGYAWLAAERLGRTFPKQVPATPPALPSSLASRADVTRAEALSEAGLDAWAADELRSVPKPSDRTAALALAAAKLRAGDARGARDLACPHAASPWKGGDPVAAQLCRPRIEWDLVEHAAHDVPTSLVYGVMLAESALDPAVSSQVGARGLMQLMPEVARGLHEARWPGRPFDADQLYVAPYNALLGTSELADRSKTLAGLLQPASWPAVVGSYNAGEDAVRRWATADMQDDEWVEAIGYVETRGYVKRVLGYAMEWRWVWGD